MAMMLRIRIRIAKPPPRKRCLSIGRGSAPARILTSADVPALCTTNIL